MIRGFEGLKYTITNLDILASTLVLIFISLVPRLVKWHVRKHVRVT